jgi:hypothetical protein
MKKAGHFGSKPLSRSARCHDIIPKSKCEMERGDLPMIFPQWLNDAILIAVQSAPVLILIVAAAVLWWRSLRPVP